MADLKLSTLSMALISRGKAFHRYGAQFLKARSPYVLVRGLPFTSKCCSAERSQYLGWYSLISWQQYAGAVPWMHLKVKRQILYLILADTGSQCREQRIGVIWSCFAVLVTILTAQFCILWSLLVRTVGRPYNRDVLWSSLEDTKAWINFSVAACEKYGRIFQMFLICK